MEKSGRYVVLRSTTIGQLVDQVNRYIDNGWLVQGGLVVDQNERYAYQFYQAMIRPAEVAN